MTTTSDPPADDPTIAMLTDHCNPTTTSNDERSDASPVENNSLPVKFEFKNKNIIRDIEHIHKNIIESIEQAFPNTFCESNNQTGEHVRAQKMDQATFQSHFKYSCFTRSTFELQCIAHHISTPATFNDIKATVSSILTQYNGFIRINKWDIDELDIVNIGWLHKAHPKVHNRDFIHDCIQYACTISNIDYVPIEIFTKNVSAPHDNNRIYANVIQFACKKNDRSAAMMMLKTCFSDSNNFLPGTFIPNDLAHKTSMDTYKTYINTHNEYITNHRAITLFNVSISDIYNNIDDHTDNTLFDELKNCPFIDWISPSPSNDTNGKIMFSTNETNYTNAIDWIDNHFIPIHTKSSDPADSSFEYPARRRNTNRDNDSYTQSLATNVSDITTSTASTLSPNAWSKPLSILTKNSPTPNTEQSTNTQPSIVSNLTTQIQSLTNMVKTLQTAVNTIQDAHSKTIEDAIANSFTIYSNKLQEKYDNIPALVDEAIAKRFATIHNDITKIENQYLAMIDQIHESWATKFQRLQTQTHSATSNTNHEPGSGSNRARKQPRTTTTLSTIQQNLFPSAPNSTQSDDITQSNESIK